MNDLSLNRFLFVHQECVLLRVLDTQRLSVNDEFLTWLCHEYAWLAADRPRVAAQTARRLAVALARKKGLGWQLILHSFGDQEGRQVAELVKFLRGGEFVVVTASSGFRRRCGLGITAPIRYYGHEQGKLGVLWAKRTPTNPLVLRRPKAADSRFTMKTQGEIEAAICEGFSRFEQEYMGRGPKSIHAHLIGDLLVVRLQGVLTAAEQQLVKTLPHEKGRELLKQVRTHLIETARPMLESMIQNITGVKVLSLHHDISTATGEELVVFTLVAAPNFRAVKPK